MLNNFRSHVHQLRQVTVEFSCILQLQTQVTPAQPLLFELSSHHQRREEFVWKLHTAADFVACPFCKFFIIGCIISVHLKALSLWPVQDHRASELWTECVHNRWMSCNKHAD